MGDEDRIKALEEGQKEIFAVLKELNSSMHELLSFRRDIERITNDQQIMRERYHDRANDIAKIDFHEEKIERLQWRCDQLELGNTKFRERMDARVTSIEKSLPLIQLASGWVFKAGFAMVALGSMGQFILAIKDVFN